MTLRLIWPPIFVLAFDVDDVVDKAVDVDIVPSVKLW
jgi:hypothetical protein